MPTEQGGRIPALALTAYVTDDDSRRSLASGFDMHVAKPAAPAELVRKVAVLAGRLGDGGALPATVSPEASVERRRGPTT